MIQQSIQQSIQQPIQQSIQQPLCDTSSQCSGNGAEHSWLGHGIAISKAFAKSLIPMENPCLNINPYKTMQDIGRLATATVLPASSIFFVVNDIANAWSGSRVPGPDIKPELPQTSQAQKKEPGPKKDVPLQQPSMARYQGSQGAKGLLALGTLASSFQYANSQSIADGSNPIPINDAETLGKIGRDPDYPLDGKYRQTADIVVTQDYQSIGSDTDPFTGDYDGQCRTISGLSDCLVDTLKQGNISRLRFTDTHINSAKTTGLAACTADGTVSDIRAENVHISTSGDNAHAGIGAGVVDGGGMVTNTTAVNSTVETSGWSAYAGIGAGGVSGTVANTTAVNSHVTTSDDYSDAGIGGGYVLGTVANTTAVNSRVKTSGGSSDAGIGGGDVFGTVANTTAVNSRVETSGDVAHAGIGGGRVIGTVDITTAVDSSVEARGRDADANIGGGKVESEGTVDSTTTVNSHVDGTKVNIGSVANNQLLCQKADPRVLTANCSARTEFLDALDLSDACPVNTATSIADGLKPILINDTQDLGKIGRHPDFPLNGTYQQTADIDASQYRPSIGDELDHFTGQYDGKDHAINNLSGCFVKNLDQGSVSNLRFIGARIKSYEAAGLVACTVNGTVSNIRAENVHIATLSWGADAGIGGGFVGAAGTVANTTAVSSTVKAFGGHAYAGIGGGWINAGGTVANTTAVNSTVETRGFASHAGIGGGVVDDGATVANTMAVNSRVETSHKYAKAGIGGGWVGTGGTIANTTAVDSTVETSGKLAYAGIGAGAVFDGGTVANTTAMDSTVKTSGNNSYVGIGGGWVGSGNPVARASGVDANDDISRWVGVAGKVTHTTALNSRVETSGMNAHAGIGGGLVDDGATIANTMAMNSTVETSQAHAKAGIGGGMVGNGGTVANTTAMNSTVETSGNLASAGIGGGWVNAGGTVANTTAVDSTVETSGKYAHAGIGAGVVYDGGTVANTTAVDSTVETSGKYAHAGIGGGLVYDGGTVANTTVVNSRVESKGWDTPHRVGRRSVGDGGMVADMDGSNAATATTAATMGITTGSLLAAGGLGIAGYTTYQWMTGYQDGLRGQKLAMKPLTRGKELASAAVNSVSRGIQGIRERMNWQSVPAQEPAPE